MRISELVSLCMRIDRFFDDKHVLEVYERFHKSLSDTLLSNRKPQPLEGVREDLYSALLEFRVSELRPGERRVAATMDVPAIIGEQAVSRIEAILRDENFDPAGVVQKVGTHLEECRQLSTKVDTLLAELEIFLTADATQPFVGQAILQIHFTGKASVDSAYELHVWAEAWHRAFESFGAITNAESSSFQLVYADKASPLVLEYSVNEELLAHVAKALRLLLDDIDKHLEIQLKENEISTMDYLRDRDSIVMRLKQEAHKFRKAASDKIARQIVDEADTEKKRGELLSPIRRSIEDLFLFLDNGGFVDMYGYTDGQEEWSLSLLAQEVRRLQHEVQRLREGNSRYERGESGQHKSAHGEHVEPDEDSPEMHAADAVVAEVTNTTSTEDADPTDPEQHDDDEETPQD